MNEKVWQGWPILKLGPPPEDGYKLRLHRRKTQRRNVQLGVLLILEEYAPGLVQGVKGSCIDKKAMQEVMKKIENKYFGYNFKQARNFLTNGIEKGNKQGLWDIETPPPVITRITPRAAISPPEFESLPLFRKLQTHFLNNLSDKSFSMAESNRDVIDSSRFLVGQFVFSAMAFGGLLNKDYLEVLPQNMGSFYCDQRWCWIDIYESKQGASQENNTVIAQYTGLPKYRWFIDRISELLMYRWHSMNLTAPVIPQNTKSETSWLYHFVKYYFKASGYDFDNGFPSNFSHLRKICLTALKLQLPGFLASYISGKHKTQSLPPLAWWRLRSNKRCSLSTIDELKPDDDSKLVEVIAVLPANENTISLINRQKFYRVLRAFLDDKGDKKNILRPQVEKNIMEFVSDNRNQLSSALLWISAWILSILLEKKGAKYRLKISSVYQYLGQLKWLVNLVGNRDMSQLGLIEFEEVYTDAIEETVSLRSKCYRTRVLQEFHHFLCQHIEPVHVDFSELSGCSMLAQGQVDANLITETEYQQALIEVDRYPGTEPRLREIQKSVLIIGYRLGLRRSEIWLLRMRHIVGKVHQELWVTHTHDRGLKSNSALRRISLRDHIPPQELSFLQNWYDKRGAERGVTKESLLFCLEDSPSAIPQEEIFGPITKILQAVSGDPTIRFHHARHSEVSTDIPNKLLIHDPNMAVYFPESMQCASADSKLKVSRKHLYYTATHLGHQSPKTTVQSYMHLSDIVLLAFLNSKLPDLNAETICELSGLSKAALYKYKKRNFPSQSLLFAATERLRKKHKSRFKDPCESLPHQKATELIDWPEMEQNPCVEELKKEPSFSSLYQLVISHGKDNFSSELWARRQNIELRVIDDLVMQAEIQANLKTAKGTSRHIRRQWWNKRELEEKKASKAMSPRQIMPYPMLKQDIDDMLLVRAGLQQLRCDDTDHATWGVEYFLLNKVASHSHIYMQDSADAVRYVDFLVKLGFQKSRISVKFSPSVKQNSKSVCDQLGYWSDLLDIPKPQIAETKAIARKNKPNGSIRIALLCVSPESKERSSYGFSFALYMSAILMTCFDGKRKCKGA